jgi:hypothetical protein
MSHAVPIACMLIFVLYSVYEVRHWFGQPSVLPKRQRWIRALGLCCLLSLLVLWLCGTYMTVPRTHGSDTRAVREVAMLWIGYGMLTFLALLALMSLALLDAREGLIRAREERRKLFRDTLLAAKGEPEIDDSNS